MMCVTSYSSVLLANKFTDMVDFTRRGQKYLLLLTCEILRDAPLTERVWYISNNIRNSCAFLHLCFSCFRFSLLFCLCAEIGCHLVFDLLAERVWYLHPVTCDWEVEALFRGLQIPAPYDHCRSCLDHQDARWTSEGTWCHSRDVLL